MPIKVLGSDGAGTYADIAEGVRFAADNGAHVINLSLGGTASSQTLKDAVAYAYNKGVTIVAAAGNDGTNTVLYPAAYDEYIIAVGATGYDKEKAPYSNYGDSIDVVAPGGDTSVDMNNDGYGDGILQQTFGNAYNDWGYYFYQGTSMATPHVAGVAALLIAHGNAVAPGDVRSAIETTSEDLGSPGRDTLYGWGLVNASQALAWTPDLPPSPSPAPSPVPPPPPLPAPSPSPAPPPTAPLVIFEDDFEEDIDRWTQDSQRDWRQSGRQSSSGDEAVEVDGRAVDAQLISPVFHLAATQDVQITFDWFIEKSLDSGEYLAFDVSSNGGNWVEYAALQGNVDEEDAWKSETVTISGTSQLQIRFRGNMNRSSEDAYVDAVKIETL